MSVVLGCIIVLLVPVALAAFGLLWLFAPVIPRGIARLFPFPPRGADWSSLTVGGIPALVEGGLPYPCAMRSDSRPTTSLDGAWQMRFDPYELPPGGVMAEGSGGDWESVLVPSVYNAANGRHTGYTGVVWYRKDFSFEDDVPGGGLVRLCLYGALLRGSAWLNGIFLGSFEGGYTSHYFDVTGAVRVKNELFIRTDNRPTPDSLPMATRREHNPGWHTYGGVYRSVEIEILPCRYIVKASSRARRVAGGEYILTAEALVHETGRPTPGGSSPVSLETVLTGPAGQVRRIAMRETARVPLDSAGGTDSGSLVAWRGELAVEALSTWSPASPALYVLEATLKAGSRGLDSVSLATGFRTFEVEKERFLLNGEPFFFKGVSKHEDHPDLGPVQTPELIERDLGLALDLGANYLRMAHYPHDVRELGRAAELGIAMSGEIPLYQAGVGFTAWSQEKRPLREFPWRLFGLRQLARGRLVDNARRQLAEMVERDGNNPAILFWSVGNECYTLGRRAGRVFSLLRDTVRFFDPGRPVTNVELTYHIPLLDGMKQGWTDMDFYCLNSYFGWYYGDTAELSAFFRRMRKRWKGKPVILSEFGADAALGRSDADGPWKAERVSGGKTYSEEYQASVLKAYAAEAARHPWIQGLSPWVFADFYNTWFPNNPVPNYNLKGLLSRDRKPKAAFRALKELYRGASL